MFPSGVGEHVPKMFSAQRVKAVGKHSEWWELSKQLAAEKKLRFDTNSNAISKQYEAESRSALKHRHTLLGDRIASQSGEEIRSHTHITLQLQGKST
jgi:hypothetical protein